jgi:hypothetical protein
VAKQEEILGRMPELVAADAAFYSQDKEDQLQAMGVKRTSVPNRSTRSADRKQMQKSRWFSARPEVAGRMRRQNQGAEATPPSGSVLVSRARRHEAMGGRHRRPSGPHR